MTKYKVRIIGSMIDYEAPIAPTDLDDLIDARKKYRDAVKNRIGITIDTGVNNEQIVIPPKLLQRVIIITTKVDDKD